MGWKDTATDLILPVTMFVASLVGVLFLVSETPPAFCPETFDSEDVSNSSQLDGRTAPYTGAGPHPVALFEVLERDEPAFFGLFEFHIFESDPNMYEGSNVDLPWQWIAGRDSEGPIGVQLVVCEYQHRDTSPSAPIASCDGYIGGYTSTVPVRGATYTYRVYEASTAKLLDKFDVAGEPPPCPERVTYREGGRPALIAQPRKSDVTARLGWLVGQPL